jgi:NADPH:quinone reductase-like Zn-dependent oxidoreductase
MHYAKHTNLPEVVGIDGVGITSDGKRVYAPGLTGMIAEKALIGKNRFVLVPDGLDDATAAALPNTGLGAAVALRYRAAMQTGEVVLVNGATGVTGRVAVQMARHYGAKMVIATGRNPESLKTLRDLGADKVISLLQEDEAIINAIKEIHATAPINIVIDYAWGHPAELILAALKGGGVHHISSRVRFVTVGSMAGEKIALASDILRSSAIEILGSGIGSVSQQEMRKLQTDIIPEMMQLAADGKLRMDTVQVTLRDIETAWQQKVDPGKRLVVLM